MTSDRFTQPIRSGPASAREPWDMDATDPQTFPCPRCATEVTETYFGPCTTCRSQLRSTLGGEQREVATAGYEPKMNVTPNAVATKD